MSAIRSADWFLLLHTTVTTQSTHHLDNYCFGLNNGSRYLVLIGIIGFESCDADVGCRTYLQVCKRSLFVMLTKIGDQKVTLISIAFYHIDIVLYIGDSF